MSTSNRKNTAILYGRPFQTVLIFALPIILGNVFQQLYNIIDAIVVGQYLGPLPLAGISVASPIMDVANALIIGGTIGVGVLIAQLCGASDYKRLKISHSSALIGGAVLTIILSVIGIIGSPFLLRAQGTESAVCAEANKYLITIFAGLIFCFLYNYFASVLRSWGNSRTPFIILLAASILHAILDVIFTGFLHMGIMGVAISTVLCQLFSAVWCIIYTYKMYDPFKLTRSEYKFDPATGKIVFGYAWAAALQQAVICLGRVLIQGMLTFLGTNVVTGYNMGMRCEAFMFCIAQGVSAAAVVCISQNRGFGDKKRMQAFYYRSAIIQWCIATVTALLFTFIPAKLISLFSSDPEVIASGAFYLSSMAFFYYFSYTGEIIQGFFRGLGRLRLTMIASLLQVTVRVVLSYFFIPQLGITGICYSVAAGWIGLNIIEGSYSIKKARELTSNP